MHTDGTTRAGRQYTQHGAARLLRTLVCAAGTACAAALAQAVAPPAAAQAQPAGQPSQPSQTTTATVLDPDAQTMARARELIDAKKLGEAQKLLTGWLKRNALSTSEAAAEAFYLRGNAKLADGEEWDSLYDYEHVARDFSASGFFIPSLEKELDVAKMYLKGRKKRNALGIRMDSGEVYAEEIILRICERMPGSRLAEQALLALGDHYASRRELDLAAETYDVYLQLFPRSANRRFAMERRVYANIAQFKGPGYDTATLRDASVQIQDFREEFPADAQRTGLSDALLARIDESAAAGMLQSARWYHERSDLVSARLTLRRLIQTHPKTASAQEAVTLLEQIAKDLPGEPERFVTHQANTGAPKQPEKPAGDGK